jgi:hypothetical protein
MADQPQATTGSHEEPDTDHDTTEQPTAETVVDQPAQPSQPAEPAPPAADRLRGRAILAGAATVLTLGGGLTGFVIGHATAHDDDGFRPANFSRQGPGDGQPRDGRPPGFDRDGRDGGPNASGQTSAVQ